MLHTALAAPPASPAPPADDPVTRALALIASLRTQLAEASRHAAQDTGICRIVRNRILDLSSRINAHQRRIDMDGAGVRRESAARNALAMLGPNGAAPAVEDVLKSARFHAAELIEAEIEPILLAGRGHVVTLQVLGTVG